MKKILCVLICILLVVSAAGCISFGSPQDPGPQEPEPQEPDMPQDPGPQEPEPMEPDMPQDPAPQEPGPSQGDKSDNPNERITMEGSVLSVSGDKVVIQWPGGEKYTLRLSENTEWDPSIESRDIVPGNYLVVTVAVEGRTQGEVVRVIQNIIAE